MNRDDAIREAALDDLLIRWWNWKAPIQPARGHNRSASGMESFRPTRQFDDENGALYSDEEALIMRQVEAEINRLTRDSRCVVYVLARALTVGAMVFVSPSLPINQHERAAAIVVARAELMGLLTTAGVM